MFSLMALTWAPLYEHLSKGFMGQPCFQVLDHWFGRRVCREGSNHEKSCAGRPGTSRQKCHCWDLILNTVTRKTLFRFVERGH